MFALNQDKLIMEMEKETFNLLISIINMNITLVNNGITELVKQDQETNDNEIYVKIYERCKDLCKKLIQTKSGETDEIFFANELTSKKRSPNSKQHQQQQINLEFNDFNPKLLAIECLLSMNLNKQNHNSIDLFKHELRDSGVLDKIIEIIKYTQTMIKQNSSNNNNDELYYLFFIKKYNRYLNFLEILVQTVSSNTATSLTSNRIELDPPQNKKLKITSNNNNNETSCTVTNQNYILNFKKRFVNELIKESLTYFYDELLYLSRDSIGNDKKIQLLLNSVKENFLLIINLTHNNGNIKLNFFFLI